MTTSRPAVLVVGTGGTIAGSAATVDTHRYQAGVFSVETLLGAAPDLTERVDLRTEEFFSRDSVDITLQDRVRLARRLQAALDDADGAPDGVVVTHGTDSMEESAYLLHLLLHTDRPVVLTGAMRPADEPGADGPANLRDAVTLAADPSARGLGTLVAFGGAVHSARTITKRHVGRLDAFESWPGPLGQVLTNGFRALSRPAGRYGAHGMFGVEDLPDPLPRVEVVVSHPEMSPVVLDALIESGPAGIVHAGAGDGNVSAPIREALDRARRSGIVIVRGSRLGSGPVARNGSVSDDEHDWVCAGDLPPFKARILLSLALAHTTDTAGLQAVFDTH